MSSRTPHPDRTSSMTPLVAVPTPIRLAGGISLVQGLILLGFAVYNVVRALQHHIEETVVFSNWGTALWFTIIGGAIAVGGIALLTHRRWGRGLVLYTEIVAMLVSISMFTSHQFSLGFAVGGSALIAFIALLMPVSMQWYEAGVDRDHE